MRDTILDLLGEIAEGIDFDTCTTLIDDGLLSSLDIIQLIGALNDEFDISIPLYPASSPRRRILLSARLLAGGRTSYARPYNMNFLRNCHLENGNIPTNAAEYNRADEKETYSIFNANWRSAKTESPLRRGARVQYGFV